MERVVPGGGYRILRFSRFDREHRFALASYRSGSRTFFKITIRGNEVLSCGWWMFSSLNLNGRSATSGLENWFLAGCRRVDELLDVGRGVNLAG